MACFLVWSLQSKHVDRVSVWMRKIVNKQLF